MSGLMDSTRWDVLQPDVQAEESLVNSYGISHLAARVMAARGIASPADADVFLHPVLERDWLEPALIPGLMAVADRVERAIRTGEEIAVFGDFDVDGMTSTALLTLALRHLGAKAHPFIPNRFGEGYGLSVAALERVFENCTPSLVVTVDNGIAAKEEVAWIVSQGIDCVVTDHHEPSDLVPEAVPVCDPKLDPACESRELAGAGVALKLVCELGRRFGEDDLWRGFTDIAALGTVSDMMLLVGENRSLVADGIRKMRTSARPGIIALATAADVDLTQITSDELPFSLVPRLNAAGRMGETDVAFDLLMADDSVQATALAARLETINTERRDIEAKLTEEAMAKAEATFHGGHVIVVSGEGWHEGVKGIVASRLVNRFHVPVILFTVADGLAKGSGRSVGSVDLFHAVEQAADLTVRFGGHAGAVGVTVEDSMVDAFRERMEQILGELSPAEFESKGEVAAIADLDELSMEAIDSLEVLQPFGQGNKKPLIASCGVLMRNRTGVGAEGDHLRFNASNGTTSVPAIMFRTPDIERALAWDGAVDLVYEPVVETWQGRSKAKLMVKDILYRESDAPSTQAPGIVDDLFENANEILARDDYASIAEADSFVTKAVGVTFEGRQDVVSQLQAGDELLLERDYENDYDPNAVAILRENGDQLGYIRRQIAAHIAPLMDEGVGYSARVLDVTGGEDDRSFGVNIQVDREKDDAEEAEAQERLQAARQRRAELAQLSYEELTDTLRTSLIGNNSLLPAQARALEKLAAHKSCLCVMATGRGKSLIFHIHAAREAILHNSASVFVYPLRALVADQSFHLSQAFEELGLSVRVLTGESSADERDAIFAAIADGSCDLVLTTPEFLTIHSRRFADAGRIGFVVVDEAHHAGTAKSGNRSSYLSMPEVAERLGHPTCLAVTATANDETAAEICRLMGIAQEDVVVDESVRDNLELVDARDLRDRDARLVSIVSSGEKCVIYVNSRDQSVMIARNLRKALPDLGPMISFYNASLSREERNRVEDAFRAGELCCIVSTSAFGEGVNLPDIRNVVLYHMPFGSVEFNQMSGRAGRDGRRARIHLLFGPRDARINERIIASGAPARNELVTLYKTLKSLAASSEEDEGSIARTNAEIAASAIAVDAKTTLDEHAVSSGVGVFRELGFLTTSGFSSARRIRMVDSPDRMQLESSVRYQEGMRIREEFDDFREWALSASANEMLARLNRPITPAFGEHV